MNVRTLLSCQHSRRKTSDTSANDNNVAIDGFFNFAIGNRIGRNFPRFYVGSDLNRVWSLCVFARSFLAGLAATR